VISYLPRRSIKSIPTAFGLGRNWAPTRAIRNAIGRFTSLIVPFRLLLSEARITMSIGPSYCGGLLNKNRWNGHGLQESALACPWEFNNLADDRKHAATVARLEAAINKWGRDTGDFPSTARRRADNTNRQTGQKFTRKIAPQREP